MAIMMRVDDLLQSITHSVDFAGPVDWWEILSAKVSHSHFDWLIDEIMAYGFTLPIELADNGDDTYTLGNGHHRMCAAILLGSHAVPVIFTDDGLDRVESHSSDHELPAASWDMWELLSQNMEGQWVGECMSYGDLQSRRQFILPTEYDNDHNDYDCDETAPVEDECHACGIPLMQNGMPSDYADHLIGCPEREWEVLYCEHEDGEVIPMFRLDACIHHMEMWHEMAIDEDEWRRVYRVNLTKAA